MSAADDAADARRAIYRAKLTMLDLFVGASVLAILLTRIALEVLGYPQIGGNGLHIAHMLWGGLVMLASLLYLLLTEHPRRYPASVVGGIGFGLYIDEIGKFVTSDNNYFFKPTAFLIYMSLLVLWVCIRFIVVRRYKGQFFSDATWPLKRHQRLLIWAYVAFHIVTGIISVATALFRGADIFDVTSSLRDYLAAVIAVVTIMFVVGIIQYRRGQRTVSASTIRGGAFISAVGIYPFTFYNEQFTAAIGCLVTLLVVIGLSEVSLRGLFSSVRT